MARLLSRRDGLLLAVGGFKPSDLSGLALWLDASRAGSVLTGGASQFVAASSQYLSIADNAALSTGNIDYWISGWAYLGSKPANRMNIYEKGNSGTSAGDEFYLAWLNTVDRFQFVQRGGTDKTAQADLVGAPSTTTWYHIFGWHDSVNDTVNISVNGGTPNSTATAGASCSDTGTDVLIGGRTANLFWDGRIANVAFGKSPPGGIAASATTIRDTLWNGSAGIDLRTLDATTRSAWGLVSAWRLNEPAGGTRADDFGGNTLTNNNSVSGADGPYTYAAQDGDAVRTAGNGGLLSSFSQATGAKKPLYKTSIVNGRPIIRFDGTDDYLATGAITLNQPLTQFLVYKSFAFGAPNNNDKVTDGVGAEAGLQADNNGGARTSLYAGALTAYAGNIANTVFAVVTYILNGASSYLYENGVARISAGNAGTNNPGGLTLASKADGSRSHQADVAEVITYSRALSASERSRVERFLGAKYAISVS